MSEKFKISKINNLQTLNYSWKNVIKSIILDAVIIMIAHVFWLYDLKLGQIPLTNIMTFAIAKRPQSLVPVPVRIEPMQLINLVKISNFKFHLLHQFHLLLTIGLFPFRTFPAVHPEFSTFDSNLNCNRSDFDYRLLSTEVIQLGYTPIFYI